MNFILKVIVSEAQWVKGNYHIDKYYAAKYNSILDIRYIDIDIYFQD